ncbi:hypothetical protein [Clostridium polynesiense]|uniref:hypothetical protein n=1 Tax=Clostridium polynesiense TaxID=1325933 RepID=UPI000AFF15FD|nr:hypothetical protein [Clostridium polynesiense]
MIKFRKITQEEFEKDAKAHGYTKISLNVFNFNEKHILYMYSVDTSLLKYLMDI